MADRSQSERSLSRLIRESPSIEDFLDRAIKAISADDRTAAILLATDLELTLEMTLIQTHLPNLRSDPDPDIFSNTGALGSFYSKIEVAFALGLLGKKTQADFHILRQVRNGFAHARQEILFSTPEVSNVCNRLTMPSRVRAENVMRPKYWPPVEPRAKYVECSLALSSALWSRSVGYDDDRCAFLKD